jgi:membrane protein
MKSTLNIIKELIGKIKNNHIGEYTAQCAYFTILAFIPLLILVLTLTKYAGIGQENLFYILNNLMSNSTLNENILGIVKEVYLKTLGTVTISAVFVLWSAGKGFFALCKGLNAAYEIDNIKNIKHRISSLILTIIFIGLTVLTLVLLVFGNSINNVLQEKFDIFNNVINILVNIKAIIIVIILSFAFTIMYKFIPKHKYKLKHQILGAIFAAISCTFISVFYSIYINVNNGFSVMYGSLTTAVLAMMWVYACMYCILLGATINKMICEKYNATR